MSADATAAHVEAALTAGAAHCVTKPVNLGAFLAIVDELLAEIDTLFGSSAGRPLALKVSVCYLNLFHIR